MRVALSFELMQECCNFICQWENEPGGVPIRIKHLLHSVSCEIFHSPSAREISRHISHLQIVAQQIQDFQATLR